MTDMSVDPNPLLDPKAEKARLKALRPWFKKKRFVLPLVLVALITFSNIAAAGDKNEASSVSTPAAEATKAPVEPAAVVTPEPTPTVDPVVAPAPEPAAPNFATYKTTGERELALLVKNPDSGIGKKIIIYANIHQFDSATGTCNFLADISYRIEESTYDYEANSMFTAGDGDSDCPILDQVIEGDSIKAWVTSAASFSYDTQAGGNTTVPTFMVEKLQILPKTEY